MANKRDAPNLDQIKADVLALAAKLVDVEATIKRQNNDMLEAMQLHLKAIDERITGVVAEMNRRTPTSSP